MEPQPPAGVRAARLVPAAAVTPIAIRARAAIIMVALSFPLVTAGTAKAREAQESTITSASVGLTGRCPPVARAAKPGAMASMPTSCPARFKSSDWTGGHVRLNRTIVSKPCARAIFASPRNTGSQPAP